MASDSGSLDLPWHQHKFGAPFTRPFPNISRPLCIGCFSITGERVFVDDARNASYLHGPPFPELPMDLNAGIASVIRKKTGHEHKDLEFVLRYIERHRKELLVPLVVDPAALGLHFNFVTLRGILRQIMCLQYERNCEFRVKVTRVNGNIYIAKEETETARLRNENMTANQRAMCSWGFKFEQYVTSAEPGSEPVTSVPVNEGEEFLGMFSSRFAGHSLMYGAEMDCIVSKEPVDFSDPLELEVTKFVELKTAAYEMNGAQLRSFDRYKSANWWSQSFLVNIDTIYAGLRDQRGMAQEVVQYSVREMPRNKPWNPTAMTLFLVAFLQKLKRLMEAINDPYAVVQVDFDAFEQIVSYKVLRGEEHQILPEWYRDVLKTENVPSSDNDDDT